MSVGADKDLIRRLRLWDSLRPRVVGRGAPGPRLQPHEDAFLGEIALGLGDGVGALVEDAGGEHGVGELLVTSMDRDGTKAGYDLELLRAISDAVSVPVIASGGVGTLDHMVEGIRDGHATAVLAASIFHFGTYTVGQAKRYMSDHGIAMRLD
jgi:hypothetical protein